MTNKEESAELVRRHIDVFSCPLCKSPMKVVNVKSLVCANTHTFDFAKQGYVNMMTRFTNSQYDKELFKARQKIIMESALYALLHEKISEVLHEKINVFNDRAIVLDAGCGEGSHVQKILEEYSNVTGVGVDISREGIKMAASKYKKSIWLVGDLANLPIADQSSHAILNILSPANYTEFKRVLAPEGLVVKVVPRSAYLKELREALFDDTDKSSYKNDETVSLFKQHFQLADISPLRYTKELTQSELLNLAQMSPLGWNSKKERIDQFTNHHLAEITVDVDILVGINKNSG